MMDQTDASAGWREEYRFQDATPDYGTAAGVHFSSLKYKD
jgi:hypothetical protein